MFSFLTVVSSLVAVIWKTQIYIIGINGTYCILEQPYCILEARQATQIHQIHVHPTASVNCSTKDSDKWSIALWTALESTVSLQRKMDIMTQKYLNCT